MLHALTTQDEVHRMTTTTDRPIGVLLMAYGTPETPDQVERRLEARLNEGEGGEDAGRSRVYVGMKHWHPYIGDVLERMAADGINRVVAAALAPHYSRMSIGGYRKAVDEAQERLGHPFEVTFVDRWHDHPGFRD